MGYEADTRRHRRERMPRLTIDRPIPSSSRRLLVCVPYISVRFVNRKYLDAAVSVSGHCQRAGDELHSRQRRQRSAVPCKSRQNSEMGRHYLSGAIASVAPVWKESRCSCGEAYEIANEVTIRRMTKSEDGIRCKRVRGLVGDDHNNGGVWVNVFLPGDLGWKPCR